MLTNVVPAPSGPALAPSVHVCVDRRLDFQSRAYRSSRAAEQEGRLAVKSSYNIYIMVTNTRLHSAN
eukprot:COSAG06_NODE_61696_length_267_cov_0.601190_1_plen_66_part_10